VATTLTKNIKTPKQRYQVWNTSDFSVGEILGIKESLGRSAKSVVFESIGGESIVRFNVSHKIYKNHKSVDQRSMGANAAFFPSPQFAGEVEENRPDFTIETGDVQIWDKFPIDDIKIITKSTGLRITVM
jgi:hypothetical protein